jgi:hypothetical protein
MLKALERKGGFGGHVLDKFSLDFAIQENLSIQRW